jgi:hypothetical protein
MLLFTASMSGQETAKTRFTIFYFGGSDCGYCNLPANIKNVNKMRSELPKHYKGRAMKFVLVVMDKDIERGLQYIKKYRRWDEVSIGEFYDNELMLEHVNRSKIAGVPHIMVYRDSLATDSLNIPTINKRVLLKDLVGGKAIDAWVKDGYPLEKQSGYEKSAFAKRKGKPALTKSVRLPTTLVMGEHEKPEPGRRFSGFSREHARRRSVSI